MDNQIHNSNEHLLNITAINNVTPLRGWYWVNEGYRYFAQSKLKWLGSLILVVLFVLGSRYLPPIMQIALIFVFPFIVGGLSIACADIELGKKMSIEYLWKGFTSPNKLNIFRYGLLFLMLMIIAQVISSMFLSFYGITQEQIAIEIGKLQENKGSAIDFVVQSNILLAYFVMTIFSLLPVIMINLFAPIILVFTNLTAFKAIQLSFIAGIKNLPAIIIYVVIYAVILAVIMLIFNQFANVLFGILGDDSSIATIIYIVTFFSAILAILSISYSSAYVAFKDIFTGENI